LRKAAKRAKAEAAADVEETPAVDDEVEAKRKRKEAKRAAKADAAAAEAAAAGGRQRDSRTTEAQEDSTKSTAAAAGNDTFTVMVRGLPFKAEQETVRKDFTECGEIVSFNMPMNEEGRPRGLAFIKYSTAAGMEAALKFNGSDYGGRYLEVMPTWNDAELASVKGKAAGKGQDKGKGKGDKGKGKDRGEDKGKSKGSGNAGSDFAVFVGGMPYSATEESLRAHFSECGEIDSVRIPTHEDGSAKGIAFLRFTKEADVDAAINLNETELDGRYLLVRKASDTRKGKDGKDKDAKGKGKDSKGKKGKDGKGKGKEGKKGSEGGSRHSDMSDVKFAAKDGSMVASTGVAQKFDDSDDE